MQKPPDGVGQRQKIYPLVLLPGDKGSRRQISIAVPAIGSLLLLGKLRSFNADIPCCKDPIAVATLHDSLTKSRNTYHFTSGRSPCSSKKVQNCCVKLTLVLKQSFEEVEYRKVQACYGSHLYQSGRQPLVPASEPVRAKNLSQGIQSGCVDLKHKN